MPEPLMYECPNCKSQVPVDPAVIGEAVACPSCNREFEAALPKGRPVGEADDPAGSTAMPVIREEAQDETTLHRVHPALLRSHPIRTLGFLLIAIAGLIAFVMGLLGNAVFGIEASFLWILGLALIVVGGIYVAWAAVTARATDLVVTNRRTIVTRGLISKNTSEVQHDDVRSIKSDRTFLERAFGYGDIALSSSGQDEMEIVVNDIPHPEKILETIRRHQ